MNVIIHFLFKHNHFLNLINILIQGQNKKDRSKRSLNKTDQTFLKNKKVGFKNSFIFKSILLDYIFYSFNFFLN